MDVDYNSMVASYCHNYDIGLAHEREKACRCFVRRDVVFIGSSGLWNHMLQTLSVVIAAVILSVFMGFPLGILIAMNKRAESIIRPILDLMQTMPTFVYLVPAVILFSIGMTPALMATTIYAIVPMIRMTSHGINHVDVEVVEAAKAFGSTNDAGFD